MFDNEMLTRIAHNLEVLHGFCEGPVILYANSVGDPFQKRQQIQSWLDSFEVNLDERDVLEKLVQGHWVMNPFLNRLLRTQQFLTLRLARPYLASKAPPPLSPEQRELDSFEGSTDISAEVWNRLSEHPLTHSMIKMNGVPPA